MHQTARRERWSLVVAMIGGLVTAACADDATAVTVTAAGTGSTTGTTDEPTTAVPTTTAPDTTTTNTTGVPTTTDTSGTTSSTTTESTTTTTTTTDTTTDTSTTTDTTTGSEVVGRSVSQTVNSGLVASSPGFKMVFTLGQPTQNQGVYNSTNFRLQGGLVGANGNPP